MLYGLFICISFDNPRWLLDGPAIVSILFREIWGDNVCEKLSSRKIES